MAFLCPAPRAGRSRVDLMWHAGRLGVRGPGPAWTLTPLDDAGRAALEPGVVELLDAFEAAPPPCGDAQVRLRRAPDGRAGLWLDLSRAGIGALVAERDWLAGRLAAGWVVELGQRGEAARLRGGVLELEPVTPHAWLPAWTPEGQALSLTCAVSSFSQPGPLINRALGDAGHRLLTDAGIERARWREWGAGYGNLSAWLCHRLGPAGEAREADPRAVGFLRENAARFFPGVTVGAGVAGGAGAGPAAGDDIAELWVIDPPRPGFPVLLRTLATRAGRPRWLLAWHCHERGLVADSGALRDSGYRLGDWIGVDAFPGTPFLEAVSLWERDATH